MNFSGAKRRESVFAEWGNDLIPSRQFPPLEFSQADTMDASAAAATISMACAGEITDCAARIGFWGISTATSFHQSLVYHVYPMGTV